MNTPFNSVVLCSCVFFSLYSYSDGYRKTQQKPQPSTKPTTMPLLFHHPQSQATQINEWGGEEKKNKLTPSTKNVKKNKQYKVQTANKQKKKQPSFHEPQENTCVFSQLGVFHLCCAVFFSCCAVNQCSHESISHICLAWLSLAFFATCVAFLLLICSAFFLLFYWTRLVS